MKDKDQRPINSVSDDTAIVQAERRDDCNQTYPPAAHVVLYQPEIPQNTGNIGRSCVGVRAKLWLVGPKGFEITDSRLKRAGLDYWQHLQWAEVANWQQLQDEIPTRRQWVFSRFAKKPIWETPFQCGDALIFGSESAGLPAEILDPESPFAVTLPTWPEVRSLNLAVTVGVALYQMLAACPEIRPMRRD